MGLHISRVEIANYRNFGNLIIEDFPERAVILGENGVGKSNLLEALRLVLDPSLPDTRRQLRDDDIWEKAPKGLSGGVTVQVVVELQGFDDDDDAKATLTKCLVGADPYVARLTYRYSPRVDLGLFDDDGQEREGEEGTEAVRQLGPQDYDFVVFGGDDETYDVRSIRRYVAVKILPALRDVETDLYQWRRNPLRELLERLPLDSDNLEKTAGAISEAVAQLSQDPNVSTLENLLSDRLGAMLGPRLLVEPTLGFASSKPEELIRSVRLFVDSERRRTTSGASLGTANVIYLGLLLETLVQQRKDEVFVSTLVGVEEPEAHLHVSLQRHLFHYLLRAQDSLLLTTHSPHIAAVAPVDSFVVLRSTPEGTVGRTTKNLPITPAEKADLERYIDVSRAELLFASAVLLTEGIAELYVLPAIANAAKFDLNGYGVVVASVHGTDFKPYRALLGPEALSTPHVVVTDGDATPDARGVKEAGLTRGASLHSDPACGEELKRKAKALPERQNSDYDSLRNALIRELENHQVFVGAQTLEVDLCGIFGPEILRTFDELCSVEVARAEVRAGVANEAEFLPNLDVRKKMLSRISALGKGRFAQRLAAHIERADVAGRIRALTGASENEPIGREFLWRLGRSAHVFTALDEISLLVRQQPLFSEERSNPTVVPGSKVLS
jgi:putative ATP-dependent endonuclease of OLD family